MKKTYFLVSLFLIAVMMFSLSMTKPADAWSNEDHRPFLHWIWEGNHATMINALLISANDQIVKHNERYVKLYEKYAERDPLLAVYHLRETCDDSVKDAFLVGLKANNLIYLIHTADDNPAARKAAIKDLKLLGKIIHHKSIQYQFPYWAELLEEGKYPSKRLSHIYVHYTIDIGDYYYERMGVNKRFYFWLGYLVNDFIVAHLCDHQDWLKEDQMYMENLYSIRQWLTIPRFTLRNWYDINEEDMGLKTASDKVIGKINYIRTKYLYRGMK